MQKEKLTPDQVVAIAMLLAIALTFIYMLNNNNQAINNLLLK